jgi:L-ascorbate metabolism protein UlaG (beta-lactamase superfamily)
MVIQYFGLGFVKMSLGDEVLAFGPISKTGDIKGPQFGANIALVPLEDKNYNGVEQVTYGNREPFVAMGPGEYEVSGTFIKGIPSAGPNDKINTIYSVVFDNMRVCHLGALAKADLSGETKEAIGDVDILFVPTYGDTVLDEAGAYKVVGALSPKIVVPMYHAGAKDNLARFFKECGEDLVKPVDKLTLKQKDLDGKDSEIIPIASFE